VKSKYAPPSIALRQRHSHRRRRQAFVTAEGKYFLHDFFGAGPEARSTRQALLRNSTPKRRDLVERRGFTSHGVTWSGLGRVGEVGRNINLNSRMLQW
jgi:hypothetical protein